MAFLTPSRLAPQGISGFQLVGTVRSSDAPNTALTVATCRLLNSDTSENHCGAVDPSCTKGKVSLGIGGRYLEIPCAGREVSK